MTAPRGRPREINTEYVAFAEELISLGTNEEIARAIGVSTRTVTAYMNGTLPSTDVLMANPKIMAALLKDAERLHATPGKKV